MSDSDLSQIPPQQRTDEGFHPILEIASSEKSPTSDGEKASQKGQTGDVDTVRSVPARVEPDIPTYPSYYYYGTPSQAPCLASSNPSKVIPNGPACCLRFPSQTHPINNQWYTLAPTFVKILDLHKIPWTSIDLVCIDRSASGNDPDSPPVAWIGAKDTTNPRAAHEAVWACAVLLALCNLGDVVVEMRASVVSLL